ncbi:MAG: hypothetical protein VKL60_20830 [Sphaerospermopsis sp.]|nr:hypothetical protein [Sphaerospermopsis sp.]
MIVYVVISHLYEPTIRVYNSEILGVFSNKEKAEEKLNNSIASEGYMNSIEVYKIEDFDKESYLQNKKS